MFFSNKVFFLSLFLPSLIRREEEVSLSHSSFGRGGEALYFLHSSFFFQKKKEKKRRRKTFSLFLSLSKNLFLFHFLSPFSSLLKRRRKKKRKRKRKRIRKIALKRIKEKCYDIYWLTSARKPLEIKGFRAFLQFRKMPLQHFCNTQYKKRKKEWLQVAAML